MSREWRDIPGYEGYYQVSNDGMVRSVDRVVLRCDGRISRLKGKAMKRSLHKSGYYCVSLHRDSVRNHKKIHQIVMHAFAGEPPPGMVVCHNDSDKRNNHIDNLRYDTQSGNMADSIELGTFQRGERNGLSKLTERDVLQIRKMYSSGKYSHRSLVKKLGIGRSNIGYVIKGRTWAHVS